MTDPLHDQLQASLGTGYTFQRELGGGGMSRVFLMREEALARDVVVKVLPPELTQELSAERFTREIRLTAALQEPHIVPVLAAGETREGLPYYIMPFVRGESLRRLLERGKVLPSEAVSILRDVARALAYAHRQGVVHRDIKPENVLLSEGTAVVTDFGIATALQASKAAAHEGRLTQIGTSLGSPAYMSPEQAVGADVDARADLYAWGLVAYELMAGAHPFAGRTTAQQLITAHLAEAPAPLTTRAPGVPPPLADLVMRCLAKEPDHRPASADALVAALAEWVDGTRTGDREFALPLKRRGRHRTRAAGIVAAGVLAAALASWFVVPVELRATVRTLLTRASPRLRVNRVVVAPFKDETGDPKLAPLGALIADYLTEGLSRLGSLQVVDTRTAQVTGAVVSRIPRFLRSADERALGEETGAQVVVAGSYYLDGDSVRFRARLLDAASGAVRLAFAPVAAPTRAPAAGIAALASRVVATLRAAADSDSFALGDQSPPPSLEAFAAFHAGYQAFIQYRTVADSVIIQPFLHAAALDSTYGTPLVALAYIASDIGQYAASDSAMARAARLRERLTREEESYLDVAAAIAAGDATAQLQAAQRGHNEHLIAYNALLNRRPGIAIDMLRTMDPDRGINIPWADFYGTRLAVAYAQRGDYTRALAAVREGERRVPSLRSRGVDLGFAAARGDVSAVRDGLEAHWRAGERSGLLAARATTLLRTRGGHEADGRSLAISWADRLYPPSAVADSSTMWVGDLLAAADRWSDLLKVTDAGDVRTDADSAAGRLSPGALTLRRQTARMRRAVALIHLDRRAEALSIDSAFARTMGARWDKGMSALARAAIAAHLGEPDRAIPLLDRAIAQGVLRFYFRSDGVLGLGSVDGDPLLLPLRADGRFQALALPDPADRR